MIKKLKLLASHALLIIGIGLSIEIPVFLLKKFIFKDPDIIDFLGKSHIIVFKVFFWFLVVVLFVELVIISIRELWNEIKNKNS